ncbi:hypothetical protein GCM10027610_128740 [Dactylosporangium cerinum]
MSRPLYSRTATRLNAHVPVRSASIATSTTVPVRPVAGTLTCRSMKSSRTSSSPWRFSNRRRFSVPVLSTTASGSIAVIRPIGRKIRRRIGISATSPTTLGGRSSVRARATASRTRPTWSPFGSNTLRPARRAT